MIWWRRLVHRAWTSEQNNRKCKKSEIQVFGKMESTQVLSRRLGRKKAERFYQRRRVLRNFSQPTLCGIQKFSQKNCEVNNLDGRDRLKCVKNWQADNSHENLWIFDDRRV